MPNQPHTTIQLSPWWTPLCAGALCVGLGIALTMLRNHARATRSGAPAAAASDMVLDVFKDDQLVARFLGVRGLIAVDHRGRCQPPFPCAVGAGVLDKNFNFHIDHEESRQLFEAGDYGDGYSLYAHPGDLYWPE